MSANRLHWEQVGYFEWLTVFRKLPLDAAVKNVGYALASYADYATGRDAHPGTETLMLATGYTSNKTVVKALGELRRLRLIERRVQGSKAGRRGWADMYYLTLTNDARVSAGEPPCQCKPAA